MVDSKENYKFDLGVKGLTVVSFVIFRYVHYFSDYLDGKVKLNTE